MTDLALASLLLGIAEEQHGVVSRRQAKEAGLTDHQIRKLIHADVLQPIHRQVLRARGAERTWHQDVMAAVLAGGTGTVASHRATAALFGLDGFDPDEIDVVLPIDHRTYVPPDDIDVVTHWTSILDEDHVTTVGAIPTMTVVRMLMCLGAVVGPSRLVRAVDTAERAGLVDRDDLIKRFQDVRESGRNGVTKLDRILVRREALRNLPWTVLERAFRDLLETAGLPQPVAQHPFERPGMRKAFLDFAWLLYKLAVEADGNIAHSLPAQRKRDYSRDRDVQLQEWRILRFTYEEIMYEPKQVAAELRDHLRSLGAPV